MHLAEGGPGGDEHSSPVGGGGQRGRNTPAHGSAECRRSGRGQRMPEQRRTTAAREAGGQGVVLAHPTGGGAGSVDRRAQQRQRRRVERAAQQRSDALAPGGAGQQLTRLHGAEAMSFQDAHHGGRAALAGPAVQRLAGLASDDRVLGTHTVHASRLSPIHRGSDRPRVWKPSLPRPQ